MLKPVSKMSVEEMLAFAGIVNREQDAPFLAKLQAINKLVVMRDVLAKRNQRRAEERSRLAQRRKRRRGRDVGP